MNDSTSSFPKEGDVILSGGPHQASWVSRGIRKYQKREGYVKPAYQFSHVCGYIGNGEMVEAVLPRVKVTPILEYLNKNIPFVVLSPIGLSEKERDKLGKEYLKQMNRRYDVLSVLWWMIRTWSKFNWLSRKKHLICSELVANAFISIGHPEFILNKDPESVMPAVFYNLEKFHLIELF